MDRDALRSLPKAELHVHLEAAIRPSLADELADRHGLPPVPTGPFPDQAAFVEAYERARDLVGSLEDLRRVAEAFAAHQRSCGVVWSEVHLAPATYGGRLGPDDGLVEAVVDGFRAGAGPDGAGVVLGINRGLGVAAAERTVDLALRWAGRGVVALGLAGDEAGHAAAPYADAVARARAGGLPCVPHAGEVPDPQRVVDALDLLGARRIAHGLAAADDDALVGRLARSGVCLDLAPSSNVLLGLVATLGDHPLPGLLAAGVPVSLGTDIPLFLGHDLLEEYERCARAWSLSDSDVAALAESSLAYALAPPAVGP